MDTSSTTGAVHGFGAISQTHTDPDGHQWCVTVHWARIDGAAIPVGLDLHAFAAEPDGIRPTGGELTTAVLRSVRVAEVIEESRRRGAWATMVDARTTARRTAGARATATSTRRPGRPADRGDDFIADIADLYHEAKAQGGEPARKPWRYVAKQLQARGVPGVTDGQLKNWSRRAKNLGLLVTKARNPRNTDREETG